MPNDFPTIADSVADALDLSDAQVSDLMNGAPLVAALPAEESSDGTTHKYSKEVGAPVVGFRLENKGRDFSNDSDQIVQVALKILDWSFAGDKAVADAWRRGGREAFLARKGLRTSKAALFAYEKQIFYGSGEDALGFVGLIDSLNTLAHEMVVNATGAAAGTGSSVYALRLGADDVQGIYKGDENGKAMDMGDTIVQNMVDSEGKNLPMYYTPACTWLALQIGGLRSVGRLCNLTTEENKTLTDDMLYELLERFPGDKKPTHLAMTRRSRGQLRKSRTATNATGAPAPIPTEVDGIPIVVTEALVNTEAIVA